MLRHPADFFLFPCFFNAAGAWLPIACKLPLKVELGRLKKRMLSSKLQNYDFAIG